MQTSRTPRALRTILGIFVLFVLCALAPVLPARADLTIEMKHNGEPMHTWIAEHKMASSFTQGGMIFLGSEKVLRLLDAKRKTCTEVTEAAAKAIGEQMAEVSKMMESLPPAAREKMQAAMKGQMGGGDAKRAVRPLGESKTINGFATAGYIVTTEGSKGETEVWATDVKKLGLGAKDYAVFRELAAFMQTMLPGMDSMREMIKDFENPRPDDVPGMPVLTIHREEGKEVWRSELVRVDQGTVPADRFAVPAGYKTEKMKMGR